MLKSYKELIVWQKSIDFTVEIYRVTRNFPREELFGLTSQIRRAAEAIPANIAEGYCRGHKPEYIQFLKISYSSGAETETHLIIANKIGYLQEKDFQKLITDLTEIMKMLNSLIQKLYPPTLKPCP